MYCLRLLPFAAVILCGAFAAAQEQTVLLPSEFSLTSPAALQHLILQARNGDRFEQQLIDGITWSSSDPKIAIVDENGIVTPVTNG